MAKQVIQIGQDDDYTGKEVLSEADQVKEAKERLNKKVAEFKKMAMEVYEEREQLRKTNPNSRAIRVLDSSLKLMARFSIMITEIQSLATVMTALSKTLDVFDSVQEVIDTALDGFARNDPGAFASLKQKMKRNRAMRAIKRKLSSMQQMFGIFPQLTGMMDNFANSLDKSLDKMDRQAKKNGEGDQGDGVTNEDLKILGIISPDEQVEDNVSEDKSSDKKDGKRGGDTGGFHTF